MLLCITGNCTSKQPCPLASGKIWGGCDGGGPMGTGQKKKREKVLLETGCTEAFFPRTALLLEVPSPAQGCSSSTHTVPARTQPPLSLSSSLSGITDASRVLHVCLSTGASSFTPITPASDSWMRSSWKTHCGLYFLNPDWFCFKMSFKHVYQTVQHLNTRA